MKQEITIKTPDQIEKMRKSGHIAALVLESIKQEIKPGMTTRQIDQITEKIIEDSGATPSFKGFGGFPAATCVSINEEVVHGIPTDRVIKDGDLVGIDVGVYAYGFHSDTAITIGVGHINSDKQKLIDITRDSLSRAVETIKPGIYLGDISAIIQEYVESAGFGVIRDLTGHGIGQQLQEPPAVPNYGKKGTGPILQEGMTIAIEPMVSIGTWEVEILPDNWTVVTADGSPSAHFEHTIAVTATGAEILTRL